MEDHMQDTAGAGNHNREPVRSRWTPKPEQILILESIFNSGMVNPPKDETVRIRKLLEKFGAVGDANVFYWFQNRRSRSRRRQRQIQATLNSTGEQQQQQQQQQQTVVQTAQPRFGAIRYDNSSNNMGFVVPTLSDFAMSSSSSFLGGSSPSCCSVVGSDDNSEHLFQFSDHHQPAGLHEIDQNTTSVPSVYCHSDAPNLHYPSGLITVFINGVATEVGRGPLDMKAMFGPDYVLFHSSGMPLQVNDYGFLEPGLQHGESYFLVPRNS